MCLAIYCLLCIMISFLLDFCNVDIIILVHNWEKKKRREVKKFAQSHIDSKLQTLLISDFFFLFVCFLFLTIPHITSVGSLGGGKVFYLYSQAALGCINALQIHGHECLGNNSSASLTNS